MFLVTRKQSYKQNIQEIKNFEDVVLPFGPFWLFAVPKGRRFRSYIKEMVLWAFYEKPSAHLVSEKNDT